MFRLPADQGLINRLGFNNEGFAAVRARLAARGSRRGILGVNIGANRDSKDRIVDYLSGIETFSTHASYLVINVSSPNTPGLRELQAGRGLDVLLGRAVAPRDRAPVPRPLLLKVAPDLSLAELDDVVAVARKRKVDGMIVSNTTVARSRDLRDAAASEEGGLSGKPLFALSTWLLSEAFKRVEGAFPLIGVGGIDSEEAAWRKLRAGATLLQLYSGFTYKGLGLIGRINKGLATRISREGVRSVIDVVGVDAGR
jgi:dihydroorotate dehydrogenase